MSDDPSMGSAFKNLDNDNKQVVRLVFCAVVQCLHEYALMVESGQMKVTSGADALRKVAGLISASTP